MKGWAIISYIQTRQVISDEAVGRVGYYLGEGMKLDDYLIHRDGIIYRHDILFRHIEIHSSSFSTGNENTPQQ